MKEQIACKPALFALAIISWTGVLLQYYLSITLAVANGKSVGEGIIIFLGYFTVLTNLFVALTASLPIIAGSSRLGHWFARPMIFGSATTSILLVGIAYHFLLRNIWQPQGLQLLADIVLHYVVPILTFAYWLVFPPNSKISVFAPLIWCLYPIGYIVYAFARGELLGSYPYYFIDVTSLGYDKAVSNSFGLLAAFIVLGVTVRTVATLRNHFRTLENTTKG
ncbi:MAG: Pr6Pr family membrane protein [Gammaproteobacteria bacterium]|nr:Pr6Pr family membrane protein [Gammaproteobacteria bacterium]MBD3777459.1 Pr6Pr family membrane protein [Thiotrichales bacterium]